MVFIDSDRTYDSVGHAHHPVAIGSQPFIVGHDYKCLPHIAPQFEKQTVKFLAVVAVEAS